MDHDPQSPSLELLNLLSDGELHSGQELANLLGVSRTAVWKKLSKLQSVGLNLESRPGKGYLLPGGLDLLDASEIYNELSPSYQQAIPQINILHVIDSTNAYLLRQSPQENISVCFAEHQTAGRGRRGRIWVSPFAKNIYLSVRMTVESGLGALEGLSLAIGVSIARALKKLNVSDIQLKWPNDILWKERKLGGVLIDVVGDPSGRCHVVVGIGLNIYDNESMSALIDQPWISIENILKTAPRRNKVASALLNELIPLLLGYEQLGFSHYRDEWEYLNAHAGKQVFLYMGATVISGLMKGVSSNGALRILTDQGEQTFHGGEVSLRGIA